MKAAIGVMALVMLPFVAFCTVIDSNVFIPATIATVFITLWACN